MYTDVDSYLTAVDRCLRRLPISERMDIVRELRGAIEEMRRKDGIDAAEALERLGPPRSLAAGYLGDRIGRSGAFSLRRAGMVLSFYGLASLGGMFVIPCGTVLAGGLMLSGMLAALAGLVKTVGGILGVDMPFIMFELGGYALPAPLVFPAALLLGALLFVAGRGLWRAVLAYIRKVSATRRALRA